MPDLLLLLAAFTLFEIGSAPAQTEHATVLQLSTLRVPTFPLRH